MYPLVKITSGLFFALLGLGYLLRPDIIERINALIKEMLLNDAHFALERKKWGVFFLFVGFLLLYMGITSLNK